MIGSIIIDLNNVVCKLHQLDRNIAENIKEPTNNQTGQLYHQINPTFEGAP